MQSPNFSYEPRIDHLRWLAATVVFLFHFRQTAQGLGMPEINSPWLALITEGHTGIGLFFTLSGFLFMRIAQQEGGVKYGSFLRNRALRILPLYFLVFLVATSIGRDRFQPADVLNLLSSNLGMPPTSYTVITGAAWTISLEFLFYAVFPFLARFTLQEGYSYLVRLLLLLLFFKVAAYSVTERSTLMYFSTFVGRFDEFLIGMLSALAWPGLQALARSRKGLTIMWLALAALLVMGNSALQSAMGPFGIEHKWRFWIVWPSLESVGWACFIMAWLAQTDWVPRWVDRLMCHGGKISFSFYLLHMAVLHVAAHWMGFPKVSDSVVVNSAVFLLITYGGTWALATLCFNTIESPFLAMRRSYLPTAR